jgi:hypothetical protein
VAATEPVGAGPATIDDASGAGVCTAGGGESNTGAWTGAVNSADGVVAGVCGNCGSVGDIGAGGTPPAAAENGVPASSPLSKLCINSPGVIPWAGPIGGVSGAPGNGAAAAAGTDADGAPDSPEPGIGGAAGNADAGGGGAGTVRAELSPGGS